jgi:hypothetical protein
MGLIEREDAMVRGLVLLGMCAAAAANAQARELGAGAALPPAAAAGPGKAQEVHKPRIRALSDGHRTSLTAEHDGLTVQKVTNKTDRSISFELRFRQDALLVGIDGQGIATVTRAGRSLRVTSAQSYERVQQLLAGSEAAFATRLLLAERESTSDLQVPEMSLLSTAAFVAALTGDVDAPRRLATRFVEKHLGIYRSVRFRNCFDTYSRESSAAWNDLQACMDEANQDPNVFNRAYRRVACNGVWLIRSESAWVEYLTCLGFGQLMQ